MDQPSIIIHNKIVFFISFTLNILGATGIPLLSRLYFVHGGSRTWLTTWLQNCGCPILLIPLAISYFCRLKTEGPNARITFTRPLWFLYLVLIGLILGLAAFLYSKGLQTLPLSTATILSATSLVFLAFFAFLIVKQKFDAYTINALVLLLVGSILLGLKAGSDKPVGETKKTYILGFILFLVSMVLNGFGYPAMEFMYKKSKQQISFAFMMEVQLVVSFVCAAFATVAMLINKDFQAIPGEAKEFELGEAKYYIILVSTCIFAQLYTLGLFGLLFSASALIVGIANAGAYPITEVLSVIIFHEKFQAEKGISLALSLWGLASYFYGEYKREKKNQVKEAEIITISPTTIIETTPPANSHV
ncbi:hypothetical protein M9H77_32125 [Catharanthus roseus]|uniref:Uncharacterized protein n=1 Tax=Catharanthus roseus TaxID=4058 RepID=A0ACC0A694_CATRO|nr:hypothetical protein M9H77_32125 [Catharanthus roseus]